MLLMLAQSRGLVAEVASMREHGWQRELGRDLAGLDLGLIGLGKIGEQMATLGKAFGMNIHAWSPNLLTSRCESLGVQYQPDLSTLMTNTDSVSVHLVLSERSTHLGYVTEQTWKVFYSQTIEAIEAWQNGTPIRQLN